MAWYIAALFKNPDGNIVVNRQFDNETTANDAFDKIRYDDEFEYSYPFEAPDKRSVGTWAQQNLSSQDDLLMEKR